MDIMKHCIETLKDLFLIHSPSGKEEKVKEYVMSKVKDATIEEDEKGNLYISKGSGTRACIVAHMDTVFKKEPDKRIIVIDDSVMIGYDVKEKEQCGLGADDKVGVYIALRALEEFDNIKVLLTVEEETGCNGADKVELDFFNDIGFALQADRKGYGEITKEAKTKFKDVDMFSDEFGEAIAETLSTYEFKEIKNGGSTDIVRLKYRGINVSAANLACGYYDPHKSTEHIILEEVFKTEDMMLEIVENLGGKKFAHKAEIKQYSGAYKAYSGYANDIVWHQVNDAAKYYHELNEIFGYDNHDHWHGWYD